MFISLPTLLCCLVCGTHHLIFDEPRMQAALLPTRADLLVAIEAEEADRAYRASMQPVQTYRTVPLAWEFDSLLPVRLFCLVCCALHKGCMCQAVDCDFVPNSLMVQAGHLPTDFASFPSDGASAVIVPHFPSVRVQTQAHLFFLVEQVCRKADRRISTFGHNAPLVERLQLCFYLHDLWLIPVTGQPLERPECLTTPVPASRPLPRPFGQPAFPLETIRQYPAGNTRQQKEPAADSTYGRSNSAADNLTAAIHLWQEGRLRTRHDVDETEDDIVVDGNTMRIYEYQLEQEKLRQQRSIAGRPPLM
jgi:hypothetical protein